MPCGVSCQKIKDGEIDDDPAKAVEYSEFGLMDQVQRGRRPPGEAGSDRVISAIGRLRIQPVAATLPKNIGKDDLHSFGVLGLIDAIQKFDYQRGLQFETYASWRIRGAIIDGLRQGDWVPRSVREKAKRIEEAFQKKLEQKKYLRSVTDAEISSYLNIKESEFQQMVQEIAVTTICSIDDPIREEDSETRLSLLIDETAKKPGVQSGRVFFPAGVFG